MRHGVPSATRLGGQYVACGRRIWMGFVKQLFLLDYFGLF